MAEFIADFDTGHCGAIHDAQLDNYGQYLATASADGHVRLWDVRKPEEPAFLADLDKHAGAVFQVAWAPIEVGTLLATVGSDGRVLIWGQTEDPGRWIVVHGESLESHGAVTGVAWAPAEHGVVVACACSDGAIVIVSHIGAVRVDDAEAAGCSSLAPAGATDVVGTVDHRWQRRILRAHKGDVSSVSWASPSNFAEGVGAIGLAGARLASAGSDGVRVWCWDAVRDDWQPEDIDIPSDLQVSTCDVAWQPWNGVAESIASIVGQTVVIWRLDAHSNDTSSAADRWLVAQRVAIGRAAWKLSWTDVGGVLMVSCGESEQSAVLMKQQLNGHWDVMDMTVVGGGA